MPRKQKKPCAVPGCPNLTDGRYCEKHRQQANKDYDRYYRSRENYDRYHNKGWKAIRAAQLHRQPHPVHPLQRRLGVRRGLYGKVNPRIDTKKCCCQSGRMA